MFIEDVEDEVVLVIRGLELVESSVELESVEDNEALEESIELELVESIRLELVEVDVVELVSASVLLMYVGLTTTLGILEADSDASL